VRHPNQVLVLLAAKSDRMVEEVQSWLGRLPKAMVLVFGLGHAGDCKNVASLLACCGRGNHSGDTNSSVTASGHYFTLVRDQGPGFYDSGLALICSHDHPDLQNVLFQLRQFFKGNVTFLSLAKCASQTAITLSCRDREVAALRLIEGSNAFRLAQGLIGMGLVLAPKDSRRRWLAKKTLRGLQILRHDGPQVLIKRMAQKLISKNAGMS
jgi:hypothetical protein